MLVFAVALACLFSGGAELRAQALLSGGTIEAISIEGTQRIEPESVRSYMRVNPGDPFDPVRLDQSLKSIFSTGLFADVTLRRDGDVLIVTVVENPIINRIAFEGNERIQNEDLENEITLRPRVVFTRTKVQNDVQRILEIYRRNGRFAVTVDPKVIQLEQNRVDLVFEINEGPRTTIQSINFVGNRAFSDGDLRDEISSTEYSWWNILATGDTYDPDRLTFDRELLRRFYLSEGYADFRVVSVVAELTPSKENFIVTFTLEEGERYKFGVIDVQTSLKNLDVETIRSDLTTVEGDWYDAEEVEESIDTLTQAVGDFGFAFVDVRPRPDRDREALTIGLTYDIQEGPKVYVERIDIEGNVRTLDRVIRREFRLVEGDAFNSSKMRRSRRRIQNLGFFQNVTVDTEPGTLPDRTIIKVNVEEQSTGDLSFGAGFSTDAGPIGSVGIRERNLLGRGQDLRLNFTLAGAATEIDLSFTEPYFLNRDFAAGFDVFRVTTDDSESSFEEERIGGSLRGGFNLTEHLRQVARYTFEYTDVSNVDNDASEIIQAEEGTRIKSAVSTEFTLDKTDSRFDPKEGYLLSFSNEVAGLGGDARFLKTRVRGAYFYPLTDNWTLSVRGAGGNIQTFGEDTQVSDRFRLGSQNIRGFKFAGVGPRDLDTDDALGGLRFYSGTVETSFPLGLPEDLDIRGRLFVDVGAVWDFDDQGVNARTGDSSDPRVAVGPGVSWNSPFGPIVVDVGIALVEENFDESELLSFSFGTTF